MTHAQDGPDFTTPAGSAVVQLRTVAVTSGRPAKEPDAPLNQPIVPASTYVGGGATGYGRYGNPGWSALEDAVGQLEGGTAISFASGMAGVNAVVDLLDEGATLLISDTCYLGVASLAAERARQGRLTLRPVPVDDTDAIVAAAEGADMVWLESPTNPLMDVADLKAVSAALAALPGDAPLLVVDNTFATPILQRPLELGADLVVHSATKFLSGHSDAVLGAVVTADQAIADRLLASRSLHGATPGVLEAFLVLRGLRTLALRVEAAQESALILAERLGQHRSVRRVRHPGWGSLLSIELADADAADRLVAGARVWVHATSLGGVESTFERRRRWPAELPTVPDSLVRLSVGIEHVDDLWADLRRVLDSL
ncbi:trans-sulfuration enzyme family protein [Propionibacteriaceae bacterium Y1685]|uniref:trans-sulfuration enzyme family protein n=1 Tax=Microlunatus sp. Y1700 TaxID=3418487 RepID=UPI003B78AE93